MTSLRQSFERFFEWVVIVLMTALAVIVVAGFLFRKLGAPLVWYDELAPILLAWLTYYGACLAALRRGHIGFPRLVEAAPWPLRLGLTLLREALVVGFFALAAWAGWKVLGVLGDTYMVSLPWMPARLTQSVIPIGAVLFIVCELLGFGTWYELQKDREAAS